MDHPLRRPEQILAYRQLRQILAAKPKTLWTVGTRDSALAAMRLMADQDIGFLIVMDKAEIVGVLSERACTRKLLLVGKSPEATPVGTIMARDVIKADIGDTFAHCLKLMHEHGIRHLPVMDKGVAVGGVSVRDLMGEAVAHHAKVIGELERERMTMLTSTA